MQKTSIFTSESVCAGHPDKICDQISDAILDAVLTIDPKGRVAIETLVSHKQVVIAGEVSYQGKKIDYKKIARAEIKRLGFTNKLFNFTDKSAILVNVHEQSPEIATGVDNEGAGDQGMMFGYACNETANLMPLPIELSHQLAMRLDEAREKKIIPYLRPDGKTQVSINYVNDKPVSVNNIVVAVPHNEDVKLAKVKSDVIAKVINPVLKKFNLTVDKKDVVVNGTGVWHIGGPSSDTGVTGRKIIVDTYGGFARVGGGAFSGKDPSKVDRSGAYAARFIAKNIVAKGLADKAEVRLAYCIGVKEPTMQEVETFGTATVSAKKINKFVDKLIDTSVTGIIKKLDLQKPQFKKTATYGHFGRNAFSWEKVE
ncbi:methionine adenosyltransferase [Patescibacteria group bacterium]|nr:methionine adenosyltransferase [Patescibacteria group bacterium]